MTLLHRLGALALLFTLTARCALAQDAVDAELLIDPVVLTLTPDEAYHSAISFAVQQNVFVAYTDPNARLLKLVVGSRGSAGLIRDTRTDHFEATLLFEPVQGGTLLRVAHHMVGAASALITMNGGSQDAVEEFVTLFRERYDPAPDAPVGVPDAPSGE